MGHTTVLITTGWIKRAEVYFQCHFHIVASFCIMYIHLRSEFAHCFSLPKIALRFSEIRRHLKHCSSVLVFACIYISCLNMMVDTLVWCSQVTYYVTKAKERKESKGSECKLRCKFPETPEILSAWNTQALVSLCFELEQVACV